jgi:cystathionine gamma-synthase/cystathionine gamma-lyase/cystathionine beta-lyase
MRLETQLLHAGEPRPRIAGAVVTPVFQSSTYLSGDEHGYHDIRYIRLNNTPNHEVLHRKLAALESAEAAVVAASGMAAISTALLATLRAGDHLLCQSNLYGGTHDLITKDLPGLGITATFVDAADASGWERALTPRTRVFYVESLTNPLLLVGDLAAVPRFARAHGLVSMIDNTFATPVNFRPCELGFDLVLHSATKYLNGHTDLVAGAAMGREPLVRAVKHKLDHLGGTLDPHAAFLLHRGLKTLALRVRHQNQSAHAIAGFLEGHRAVERVHYPGLPSHAGHARGRELMRGFGGVLSFELRGGVAAAEALLRRVELPAFAPSLGGTESLITRPAATSHAGLDPDERRRIGIADGLIRLSVGIEATEDLVEDLDRALA